jgi:hypothetical protein
VFAEKVDFEIADQTIFERLRQQLSYENLVKKFMADEQWWAVSMTLLNTGGRWQ